MAEPTLCATRARAGEMRKGPAAQQQRWSLLLVALLFSSPASTQLDSSPWPEDAAGVHGTRSARKVLLQVQSSGPAPPSDGHLTGALLALVLSQLVVRHDGWPKSSFAYTAAHAALAPDIGCY